METKTYKVAHRTPLDPVGMPAGTVAIDAGLQISIIEADPAFAERLTEAAHTMNNRRDFLLHADPEDPMSRANTKQLVPRDSEVAPEALLESLRQTYGFELTEAV